MRGKRTRERGGQGGSSHSRKAPSGKREERLAKSLDLKEWFRKVAGGAGERQEEHAEWSLGLAMREPRGLGEGASAGVRLGWKVGGAQRQAAGGKREGRRESR